MSVKGYVNLDTGATGITKLQVEVIGTSAASKPSASLSLCSITTCVCCALCSPSVASPSLCPGTCFISLALFGLAYDTTMGALGCGVMLSLWTYLGGGHYNPAVSIAYSVRDGFDVKSVGMMLGAQITGATVAVLFASTVGVGAQSNDSTQSVTSSVVEALFVLQLTLTYFASQDALAVGLSYFSGLAAFGSAGATMGNPAIVIGVALGNAILGNGFELSNAAIVGSVVPLLAGAATQYVLDLGGKLIPRFNEGESQALGARPDPPYVPLPCSLAPKTSHSASQASAPFTSPSASPASSPPAAAARLSPSARPSPRGWPSAPAPTTRR